MAGPADVATYLLAGADVVMTASALLRNGPGYATVLLDGVTIVERDTNNVVVMNPSFEASGTVPALGPIANLAGWTGMGTSGVDVGAGGAQPASALIFFEAPAHA